MIKVAIQGAASKVGGELIRLLINHPDVELKYLQDDNAKFRCISSVHHGLIGELEMLICDCIQYEEIDVLFICDSITEEEYYQINSTKHDELKIIDITGCYRVDYEKFNMVYGLSEMNRKPLVRGAKRAVVPSSVASVTLILLYPLFLNCSINEQINISVSVPQVEKYDTTTITKIKEEILNQILKVQPTFQGDLNLKVVNDIYQRGFRLKVAINSDAFFKDIENIYNDIYDDHNLTFVCKKELDIREVEGTDKCLISVYQKEQDRIEIEAIADHYMRGSAGEAVHLMNLLCGLMERTGLMLKSIAYY